MILLLHDGGRSGDRSVLRKYSPGIALQGDRNRLAARPLLYRIELKLVRRSARSAKR
ncbi:hypothetical protein QUB63_12555 [Microcoleus sp. ARI1-B5]|uniref:hypothetical protein n=1 Tax=unclassified Microcoleus TaxID=2642155 RepID=UPI002FD5B6B7